jgi:hypothetical protein
MYTNRLFNLIVAAVLIVVIALAVQQAFATKAIAPETSGVYSESKEEALREVQLGERYGVLPDQIAWLIAEQKIHREYILGERYGVTPQQSPRSNASLPGDQAAGDFYQRHPDWTWAINDQNASIPVSGVSAFPDYFQRHPELSAPTLIGGLTASDYFMRHPELIAPAASTFDMTDYYFRQAAIKAAARKIDLTDYFFRHR